MFPRSRIASRALIVALSALAAANVAMLVLWLAFPAPPREISIGTPDVGGPFELIGADGRRISSSALLGRQPILVFGWTRDPGLSEPALRVLEDAFRRLGRKSEILAPIFVGLDPERDTASDLGAFVLRAGSRAMPAFAERTALEELTARYRLYHKRIQDPALPGGYSIDQSHLYYVLKRDGSFGAALPYTNGSAELAEAIAKVLH